MDGIYMNVVFLPPGTGPLPPSMYVSWTQGSLLAAILPPGTGRYHPRCTCPELRGPSRQPWKSINFQASLQGNKCHENWSQGHPKSWKIEPEIMRNPISAKVDFCNTFHAECLFLQSRTPEFIPKNHQKKQPGNRYEKKNVQKYSKSSQNRFPKSTKKR